MANIDIVELATRLAHKRLRDNWNDIESLYEEHYDEYVALKYTSKAEKKFNEYYRMFFNIIKNTQINES